MYIERESRKHLRPYSDLRGLNPHSQSCTKQTWQAALHKGIAYRHEIKHIISGRGDIVSPQAKSNDRNLKLQQATADNKTAATQYWPHSNIYRQHIVQ